MGGSGMYEHLVASTFRWKVPRRYGPTSSVTRRSADTRVVTLNVTRMCGYPSFAKNVDGPGRMSLRSLRA